MFFVLVLLIALSTTDGLLTIYEMESGFIEEFNPLMALFLSISPGLFMMVKGIIMVTCCAILWRKRRRPFAKLVAAGAVVLYLVIIGWHVHNLYTIHSSL